MTSSPSEAATPASAPLPASPLPGIARSEEELWYEYGSPSAKRRLIRLTLTALNRTFSTHFFPYLNLAIEKR